MAAWRHEGAPGCSLGEWAELLMLINLKPDRFRLNQNRAFASYFDAFSSREPVSTSSKNAIAGRKRTEVEFAALLDGAGFRLEQ
jgi:hypothetical protein